MRTHRLVGSCLALLALTGGISPAQESSDRPVFRSSTEAVTVDVVVRDAEGRPVSGLTVEDFEVLEDGVPQQIISLVEAGDLRADAGSAVSEIPLVEGGTSAQSIVALIFHQLPMSARVPAVDAARSMVDSLARDEYAGIFTVIARVHTKGPPLRRGAGPSWSVTACG